MKTGFLLLIMLIAALLAGCDDTDPLVPDEEFILSIMVLDTDGQPEAGMTVARLNSLEGIVPSLAGRVAPEAADTISSSYPNPWYGSVTIDYSTTDIRKVLLEVTDWLGRPVMTPFEGLVPAGYHSLTWWDGIPTINGVYTFSLTLTDTLDVPEYSWVGQIKSTMFDLMEIYRHEGIGTTDATGFFSTRDLDYFPSLQGHGIQDQYNEGRELIRTFSFSDTVTIRVSTPPPPAGGWIYHMSRDIVLVDGPNYLEFGFVPDDSTGVFVEGR